MTKSTAKLEREIAKFLVESEIENASGPTGQWKVTDRLPTKAAADKIAAWHRSMGGNSRVVRSHMDKDARCTTCARSAGDPYRRRVGGKIVEGCIDDAHTGHLYGESLRWHMRPEAKSYRASAKSRLRELLKPLSRSRTHSSKFGRWPEPFEGMRVVVTNAGAKRNGVRPGGGTITRVASPDVRYGPATSQARIMVATSSGEFATDYPSDDIGLVR